MPSRSDSLRWIKDALTFSSGLSLCDVDWFIVMGLIRDKSVTKTGKHNTPYRIQCNSSSNRSLYRIQCNSGSNKSPYRI